MESLIPKLFILSIEASIVLFLILIVIFVLNTKSKRQDISSAKKMVVDFVSNKDQRISDLRGLLEEIGFSGNTDEQATQFYELEKTLVKEFVSLYLQHDSIRLLNYPKNITNTDNSFLKVSGSADTSQTDTTKNNSEENANATILAREQEESNDVQLKELSELRLKNTELNEHLFEALETITELMTEHGKKTGQEIESNSKKVLEAIIYLRDKRLGKEQDNSDIAVANNNKINTDDASLDDSILVNLGINDDLESDLDTLIESADNINTENDNIPTLEPEPKAAPKEVPVEQIKQNSQPEIEETSTSTGQTEDDEDPWAEALAEQAMAETKGDDQAAEEEEDPWADALAEQAAAETEDDPWAEALAEQNAAENKE